MELRELISDFLWEQGIEHSKTGVHWIDILHDQTGRLNSFLSVSESDIDKVHCYDQTPLNANEHKVRVLKISDPEFFEKLLDWVKLVNQKLVNQKA